MTRVLLTALILSTACAGPVLAQGTALNPSYEARWQEQQAADRLTQNRSVALENQVGALEAQVLTESRLRDVETQRHSARNAAPSTGKAATVMPSNIDAWMAESNARVRAAAANRR